VQAHPAVNQKEPAPNLRATYRVGRPEANPFVKPEDKLEHAYIFYAGPKHVELLEQYGPRKLQVLLDFTTWVPGGESLAPLFAWILRKLHSIFGSYGVAIILLTLIVRGMLHPLSRASMSSMYKMKRLQPKIKEIQDRYKGKKSTEAAQKMQLEILALYRANGTNPFLGCLPTFLQLPVFIGLYNALAYSIELRHKGFLYITDLARPDRLFSFGGATVPFLGGYFNLLPILMVITMIVQQKMQPVPPDEQQRQQMKIMQYMLVVMGVLFYHVPSGLVLYFLTSSLLGMLEQKYVTRKLEAEDAAKARG
jgi:YidC/Oxa1 family membrane protein insertase